MVEPIHMLKTILDELVSGRDLTPEQAYRALNVIMNGDATDAQIGGFLIALRMKGETAEEIGGFARAMRDNAVPIRTCRRNVIDTCGTGGDRVDTFNISTAAALVASGAGVAIAKHGNRAVSSRCGSADVLEALVARGGPAPGVAPVAVYERELATRTGPADPATARKE